jgi:acyl-CoA reductase-like NAD-dependent aldehyde dehydrogenase
LKEIWTRSPKPKALTTASRKRARQNVDIPRAVSNFKFYATAAMHTATEAHETVGQAINYTLRQPLGVVGCISPWNLPLYLFSGKSRPRSPPAARSSQSLRKLRR